MTFRADQLERNDACDATHRGGILDTHPTHACSEQIRRSPGVPIAPPALVSAGSDPSAPILERARSALRRRPC